LPRKEIENIDGKNTLPAHASGEDPPLFLIKRGERGRGGERKIRLDRAVLGTKRKNGEWKPRGSRKMLDGLGMKGKKKEWPDLIGGKSEEGKEATRCSN